jgi:TetR/AcrR family transcriptional regulator, regulator of cefoperazone and chloramphenicol sensitivity
MRVVRRSSKPLEPQAAGDPTRAKLLKVAGRAFAERGFHATTIREICRRAGTNVAAVNYHFHDKIGLYTEVLQESVRAKNFESIRDAFDRSAPPEQTLRDVIRMRLRGMRSGNVPDYQLRIMAHELAQPTPVMSRMINKVSRPIYERFLELVGKIIGLPTDHEKTRMCVHSIMGQIFLYVLAAPVLVRLWPELDMTPVQLERIADHISDFSLAYLREVRSAHQRMPRAVHARRR